MHSATELQSFTSLLTFFICEMCTKSSYPTLLLGLSYGRVEMRFVKLTVACQSTIPIAVINPPAIVNGRFLLQ